MPQQEDLQLVVEGSIQTVGSESSRQSSKDASPSARRSIVKRGTPPRGNRRSHSVGLAGDFAPQRFAFDLPHVAKGPAEGSSSVNGPEETAFYEQSQSRSVTHIGMARAKEELDHMAQQLFVQGERQANMEQRIEEQQFLLSAGSEFAANSLGAERRVLGAESHMLAQASTSAKTSLEAAAEVAINQVRSEKAAAQGEVYREQLALQAKGQTDLEEVRRGLQATLANQIAVNKADHEIGIKNAEVKMSNKYNEEFHQLTERLKKEHADNAKNLRVEAKEWWNEKTSEAYEAIAAEQRKLSDVQREARSAQEETKSEIEKEKETKRTLLREREDMLEQNRRLSAEISGLKANAVPLRPDSPRKATPPTSPPEGHFWLTK